MRFGLLTAAVLLALASCAQSIQGQCAAAHQGDPGAEKACIATEEARLLTGVSSPRAHIQRGGR